MGEHRLKIACCAEARWPIEGSRQCLASSDGKLSSRSETSGVAFTPVARSSVSQEESCGLVLQREIGMGSEGITVNCAEKNARTGSTCAAARVGRDGERRDGEKIAEHREYEPGKGHRSRC